MGYFFQCQSRNVETRMGFPGKSTTSKSSWVAANHSRGELIESRIFPLLVLARIVFLRILRDKREGRWSEGRKWCCSPMKAERIDHTWWEFHFYWRDKKMRRGLSEPFLVPRIVRRFLNRHLHTMYPKENNTRPIIIPVLHQVSRKLVTKESLGQKNMIN